jgi:hypothetical protein
MKSKAIFLLAIFMLNTLVGFGCALHFHQHCHSNDHSHAAAVAHHKGHHLASAKEHGTKIMLNLGFSKEKPCCKNLNNNLATRAKLNQETSNVLVQVPVLWFRNYYTFVPLISIARLNIVRSGSADFKLPDKDIRVAIRSFQI